MPTDFINHLVSRRRSTDLEVFDSLINRASIEAQEVLEKFRDNHIFDPEKILATELHIARFAASGSTFSRNMSI
jgi:hypothetical protein